MNNFKKVLLLILLGCYTFACTTQGGNTPDRELVWSDEFNYQGAPNPEKWAYDLGNGCPTLCGWGNNELQYYTQKKQNVRVDNGVLVIEAHKADSAKKYTSARLITKTKGDWKYGYIEVRAKLPEGKGTWPAIWMLPTEWKYGGWPESGEIDIMEHVGHDQGNVLGTVHTLNYNHMKGTQQTDTISIKDASDEFHTYAINWTKDSIQFIADEKVYNTFRNDGSGFESWPFDQEFHLLLNIAIGGNWGGMYGVNEAILPQKMEIDYVRVYKKYPADQIINN